MRFVHDIDDPGEVVLAANAYAKLMDKPFATSLKVDMTIVAGREQINIQGNGKHVLRAFKQVVEQIELLAADMVESGDLDPNWNKED